jgi:hypothetical protein
MTQIRVEVAYARADEQRLIELNCEQGITALEAVQRCGIQDYFEELKTKPLDLGVFGRPISHDDTLEHGDRVEIYRPLKLDPKQARQLRAQKQKKSS